jgi:hypothetical protein
VRSAVRFEPEGGARLHRGVLDLADIRDAIFGEKAKPRAGQIRPDPTQLGENHQVLAYGYDLKGSLLTLHVYDPRFLRCRRREPASVRARPLRPPQERQIPQAVLALLAPAGSSQDRVV